MSVVVATDGQARGGHRGQQFLKAARASIPHEAIALAIVDVVRPRAEGFLVLAGVDAGRVAAWCDANHRRDPIWSHTCRHDAAEGVADDLALLPAGLRVRMQTFPASLDHRRVWLLAIGRARLDFTEADRVQAALLVRQRQLGFDHCPEAGLGRVLLDGNSQLLHADPATEARIATDPDAFARFTAELRHVVAQRWPGGAGSDTHDLILPGAASGAWVRFNDYTPDPRLPAHRYLEFRPTAADDPPPVGLLDDARVAQALGYLSDRFAQTPPLARIAEAVDISPFHFHRLFTREVGVSPKNYLLRMQMLIAKWLLTTTRQPVHQVATATGFSSHGHFTATFHRLVGMSPTAYRTGEAD